MYVRFIVINVHLSTQIFAVHDNGKVLVFQKGKYIYLQICTNILQRNNNLFSFTGNYLYSTSNETC